MDGFTGRVDGELDDDPERLGVFEISDRGNNLPGTYHILVLGSILSRHPAAILDCDRLDYRAKHSDAANWGLDGGCRKTVPER